MFRKRQLKPVSLRQRTKIRRQFNKKIFFRLGGFAVVLILAGLVILLVKTHPFQIKQVHFLTPSFCVSNTEIEAQINPKDQNFFTPNFYLTEKKVTDKYPCLKSISIKKVFPNSLEVQTTPRQKAVVIVLYTTNLDTQFKQLEATSSTQTAQIVNLLPSPSQATKSATLVADQENVVFPEVTRDSTLPVINVFDQNINSGQKLENDLVNKSLQVVQTLQKLTIPERQINVRDSSIYIDSDPSINLSLTKDFQRQLISLQLILQKAKIESKQVQKIDLRFDKAVVVYSAK